MLSFITYILFRLPKSYQVTLSTVQEAPEKLDEKVPRICLSPNLSDNIRCQDFQSTTPFRASKVKSLEQDTPRNVWVDTGLLESCESVTQGSLLPTLAKGSYGNNLSPAKQDLWVQHPTKIEPLVLPLNANQHLKLEKRRDICDGGKKTCRETTKSLPSPIHYDLKKSEKSINGIPKLTLRRRNPGRYTLRGCKHSPKKAPTKRLRLIVGSESINIDFNHQQ